VTSHSFIGTHNHRTDHKSYLENLVYLQFLISNLY